MDSSSNRRVEVCAAFCLIGGLVAVLAGEPEALALVFLALIGTFQSPPGPPKEQEL